MGKVIILEGPDGGGKTTLARELEKRGWVYKHEGPPPLGRDQIAYYLERLNESIESENNIVHDRLWLGERIYGRIARNNDTVGAEGQRLFLRLHTSKRIRQYICLPGMSIALKNYYRKLKDPNDYLKSTDKFIKIYKLYNDWWRMNGFSVDLFDYQNNSVDDILNREFLDDPLPRGTVGNPNAKYLFIGDKPNHPTIDVPFHALNGSSGYFNQAVRLTGINEENLAVSNARDPKENWHNALLMLESLHNIKYVFLMGGIAQDWWNRSRNLVFSDKISKLKIYSIEHPSYLKRFHGNNPQLMADRIRGCLNGDTNQE